MVPSKLDLEVSSRPRKVASSSGRLVKPRPDNMANSIKASKSLGPAGRTTNMG
jgi:hypothetical protein